MTFLEALANAPHSRVITVEISPPKGAEVATFLKRCAKLKGQVAAINIPDCQRAILKMSSLVAAYLVERELDIPTVWQLTCRDRNLMALQADLLGAQALGLKTVLALTGDPVEVGDQKGVAKNVMHTEAVGLLKLINQLNSGLEATGEPLKAGGTHFIKGSALNVTQLERPAQFNRLCHKLEAGVSFFQTQPVYSPEPLQKFEAILDKACKQVGLSQLPPVLVGLVPPRTADAARHFNAAINGVAIPQSLIDQLERSSEPMQESIAFCADVAAQMSPYVQGFHLMPVLAEVRALQLVVAIRQTLA